MAERGALLEQTKEREERRKAEAAAALARTQEQLAAETFCCNGAHWLHMARISFVLFVALWLASMLMLGARVDAKQPALMLAVGGSFSGYEWVDSASVDVVLGRTHALGTDQMKITVAPISDLGSCTVDEIPANETDATVESDPAIRMGKQHNITVGYNLTTEIARAAGAKMYIRLFVDDNLMNYRASTEPRLVKGSPVGSTSFEICAAEGYMAIVACAFTETHERATFQMRTGQVVSKSPFNDRCWALGTWCGRRGDAATSLAENCASDGGVLSPEGTSDGTAPLQNCINDDTGWWPVGGVSVEYDIPIEIAAPVGSPPKLRLFVGKYDERTDRIDHYFAATEEHGLSTSGRYEGRNEGRYEGTFRFEEGCLGTDKFTAIVACIYPGDQQSAETAGLRMGDPVDNGPFNDRCVAVGTWCGDLRATSATSMGSDRSHAKCTDHVLTNDDEQLYASVRPGDSPVRMRKCVADGTGLWPEQDLSVTWATLERQESELQMRLFASKDKTQYWAGPPRSLKEYDVTRSGEVWFEDRSDGDTNCLGTPGFTSIIACTCTETSDPELCKAGETTFTFETSGPDELAARCLAVGDWCGSVLEPTALRDALEDDANCRNQSLLGGPVRMEKLSFNIWFVLFCVVHWLGAWSFVAQYLPGFLRLEEDRSLRTEEDLKRLAKTGQLQDFTVVSWAAVMNEPDEHIERMILTNCIGFLVAYEKYPQGRPNFEFQLYDNHKAEDRHKELFEKCKQLIETNWHIGGEKQREFLRNLQRRLVEETEQTEISRVLGATTSSSQSQVVATIRQMLQPDCAHPEPEPEPEPEPQPQPQPQPDPPEFKMTYVGINELDESGKRRSGQKGPSLHYSLAHLPKERHKTLFSINDARHAFTPDYWWRGIGSFFCKSGAASAENKDQFELIEDLRFVQVPQTFTQVEKNDPLNRHNYWYYGLGGLIRDTAGSFTSCGHGAIWRLHQRNKSAQFEMEADTLTEDFETSWKTLLSYNERSKYLAIECSHGVHKHGADYQIAQTRWALGGLQGYAKLLGMRRIELGSLDRAAQCCTTRCCTTSCVCMACVSLTKLLLPLLYLLLIHKLDSSVSVSIRHAAALAVFLLVLLVLCVALGLQCCRHATRRFAIFLAIENDMTYPIVGLFQPVCALLVLPSYMVLAGTAPVTADFWYWCTLFMQLILQQVTTLCLVMYYQASRRDEAKARKLQRNAFVNDDNSYALMYEEWATIWPLWVVVILKWLIDGVTRLCYRDCRRCVPNQCVPRNWKLVETPDAATAWNVSVNLSCQTIGCCCCCTRKPNTEPQPEEANTVCKQWDYICLCKWCGSKKCEVCANGGGQVWRIALLLLSYWHVVHVAIWTWHRHRTELIDDFQFLFDLDLVAPSARLCGLVSLGLFGLVLDQKVQYLLGLCLTDGRDGFPTDADKYTSVGVFSALKVVVLLWLIKTFLASPLFDDGRVRLVSSAVWVVFALSWNTLRHYRGYRRRDLLPCTRTRGAGACRCCRCCQALCTAIAVLVAVGLLLVLCKYTRIPQAEPAHEEL